MPLVKRVVEGDHGSGRIDSGKKARGQTARRKKTQPPWHIKSDTLAALQGAAAETAAYARAHEKTPADKNLKGFSNWWVIHGSNM
ncbi:hypothetical protein [Acidovorax sp. Root267]|uniref:hypothetical protein n=1 Tax=Acidovorax sp. Root267 TaxID=1736505 RepID=UPI001124E5D3|nr:hypothetical protein [Acidovorax sp. Root267]